MIGLGTGLLGKDMDLHNEDRFVFTLPALLNILFRGRAVIAVVTALGLAAGIGYGIVVKPLYRASVQVRPGIVAYTEQGGALRGWIREDIVHFFAAGLFWQDLRENPQFAEMKAPPIVNAEFVPGAIQFMPGGDVITLTNLSTAPGRAVDILQGSMDSFISQGTSDTLRSDLNLTRRNILVSMQKITQDIELVAAKESKVSLEIEQAQSEKKVVAYEREKLELDLKNLAEENAWHRRTVEKTLTEVSAAQDRLVSAEKMFEVAVRAEQGSSGSSGSGGATQDPVGEVLKQTASREQAGRVGDLLLTVNELSTSILEGQVRADSLQTRISANEQEMNRLKKYGELVLAKQEIDIKQKIGDLEIHLQKDLPYERAMLQNDLDEEKVKLEIIAPLEQVGKITVSEKPVRPRKFRAAAILTLLAFCGSLVLVLVWEYLLVNREEITRPRRA
jgi:hypothetical protein